MKEKLLSYKYNPTGGIDYPASGIFLNKKTPSFDFEKIDWKSWGQFTVDNYHVPIITGIIYLTVIFGIQHWMKTRKPFDLKRELFLWNGAIGIYSILGFTRVIGGFFRRVSRPDGVYEAACTVELNAPITFWYLTFVFSKFVELGDTVFIVLRKKPLQLLQWYHHMITLALCWYSYGYFEPVQQYFVNINLGVHGLMYPYFALRALDIKIPKMIANVITSLQLTQMMVALGVNTYTGYLYHSESAPCLRHPSSIKMFSFAYGSFVVLFGHLFYRLVVSPKRGVVKRD